MMSLSRQSTHFVLVGMLQLALDWGIFVLVTGVGGEVSLGNLAGRLCGAMLGFWLNGRLTFAAQGRALLGWRRFFRFAVLWSLLTIVSTWLLQLTESHLGLQWVWLAKPMVESLLAVVSFFLWRQLVYR